MSTYYIDTSCLYKKLSVNGHKVVEIVSKVVAEQSEKTFDEDMFPLPQKKRGEREGGEAMLENRGC
ncbi:MAG: hypothetical protein D3910_09015 [Candidatus Electrothrix sp. ATG2]|nr:hypothetical protein [Candidatus Electrothrix sp. ATG2]